MSLLSNESGVVAIIVVLVAAVLFGFVALVIDTGRYRLLRTETVRAADAAALAAVGAMKRDESVEQAVDQILALNAPKAGAFTLIGFQPNYADLEMGIVLRGEAFGIFSGFLGHPVLATEKHSVARHLVFPFPDGRDVLVR